MREIYTAFTGASAAWRQVEHLSNNVANANTQGYREQRIRFELAGETQVKTGGTTFSSADGELITDGVAAHLALQGDGFFALADGTATRDGGFRMDGEGQLVTAEGTQVLSDGGPIQFDPKETFKIDRTGLITGSMSGEVGHVKVIGLSNATPLGGGRWQGTEREPGEYTIIQGAREGSNVDAMKAMVELIEASRYFDAQQKVMQTSDEMQSRLHQIKG